MKIQFNNEAYTSVLDSVRTNEQLVKDVINEWGPVIVEAIRSGHSIDKAKQLMDACNKDRAARLGAALAKFLPNTYDRDNHKFGKKEKNKSALARKEKAWEQFKESGLDFYSLLEPVKKAKRTEKTDKQKIEQHLQQIKKLAPKAGLTKKELLAMFAVVCDIEIK